MEGFYVALCIYNYSAFAHKIIDFYNLSSLVNASSVVKQSRLFQGFTTLTSGNLHTSFSSGSHGSGLFHLSNSKNDRISWNLGNRLIWILTEKIRSQFWFACSKPRWTDISIHLVLERQINQTLGIQHNLRSREMICQCWKYICELAICSKPRALYRSPQGLWSVSMLIDGIQNQSHIRFWSTVFVMIMMIGWFWLLTRFWSTIYWWLVSQR